MRSESIAWLLNIAGLDTIVLQGGYKAYRKYIRESFLDGPRVFVIGGMTGCGKTDVLNNLRLLGEQMLDLEHIARHKGSVFGNLGQENQPTNEQFENNLADAWLRLNPDQYAWLEDESFNIGKVNIPKTLFQRMITAHCVIMEVPVQERVKRIINEYAGFDIDLLKNFLDNIQRRLGGSNTQMAKKAIDKGDFNSAVDIILKYYDKAYGFSVMKREPRKVHRINDCTGCPEEDAHRILEYVYAHEF
jgi:tRNA 2-selenouridine synthase